MQLRACSGGNLYEAHANHPRTFVRYFQLTELEHQTLSLQLHELACLSEHELAARGADVAGM